MSAATCRAAHLKFPPCIFPKQRSRFFFVTQNFCLGDLLQKRFPLCQRLHHRQRPPGHDILSFEEKFDKTWTVSARLQRQLPRFTENPESWAWRSKPFLLPGGYPLDILLSDGSKPKQRKYVEYASSCRLLSNFNGFKIWNFNHWLYVWS